MDVTPLSTAERQWLKKLQTLLRACPSTRLGAYTTGDASLAIYDKPVFDAFRETLVGRGQDRDDVEMHDELGTVLTYITMPFQVDGVSG